MAAAILKKQKKNMKIDIVNKAITRRKMKEIFTRDTKLVRSNDENKMFYCLTPRAKLQKLMHMMSKSVMKKADANEAASTRRN